MGFLEDRDLSDAPTIPEYFRRKTIFITGGSGFIGKVLTEKLLYSCTELDRIYLLMREKKGVKAEERLEQMYSLPCFDRLRTEKPNIFRQKVFAIAGDVAETGLGLSDEDRALIVNRVNIIFHVAASVRFDDTLSYAVRLNLRGTKEMMDLAKDMRHLSSFVHVSTSYSNTNNDVIEESMYPPHADWRDILHICDDVDEDTLRVLTSKYLGQMPNTYVFTKQLAEHVVYEHRGQLPVVITRPSIVTSSISEPTPGWVENFNGPVGLCVGAGKGILRSVLGNPDTVSDYIMVDVCVRHIIAAAWIRGIKEMESIDDVEIYNCCAGQLLTVSFVDVIAMSQRVGESVAFDNALWTVCSHITSNETVHYINVIFTHLLPAIFIDIILWLLGKKPMLVRIQRRIYTANLALRYFMMQQWTFNNKHFLALREALKPEDRTHFYYEIENLNLDEYFSMCILGARRFLLQEKDEDIPKAIAHSRRINMLDKILRMVFYGCLVYWLGTIVIRYYGDILYDAFIL